MKRLLVLIVSLIPLVSNISFVAAGDDFFTSNVIGDDALTDRFESIKMKGFVFKSDALNTKLMETRYFLSKVKRDAITKVKDGSISKYAAEDIANSLEYVTYSMNTYFTNMKSYERTGRKAYKTAATQNLKDANMLYDQLRAATWRSVRQ